jgi:hypothetical protein
MLQLPMEKSKGPWKSKKRSSYQDISEARKEEPENVIEFPKEEINVPNFMNKKALKELPIEKDK